jgi:aryl-alcohol dehydrogenase-like predicted oxidoreductase
MVLGRTGVRVSRMGLGAMTWGEPRFGPAQGAYGRSAGREEEAGALAASVAAGVTLVDTAPMYSRGESERRVGELVRAHDGAVQVATKFSPVPWQLAGSLPTALDASLSRLGLERVPLYQIHFKSWLQPIPTLMKHLAAAVRRGKALAVGVSNFSADQMRLAHRVLADEGIPLASNQVQYSLVHRSPETDGTLDACRELGITLIAYSPLGMGLLSGKYRVGTPRANGYRRFLPLFRKDRLSRIEPLLGLLGEIGASRGRAVPEVALRWLLEDPVVLPIPGAKDASQARTNAGALAFALSADEREALSRASAIGTGSA